MAEKKQIPDCSKTSLVFLLCIVTMYLTSCSPARYVPKGQYLLQEYEIKYDNKALNIDELDLYVKQRPNKKALGVPVHLHIYNLVNPDKEAKREAKRKPKDEEYNRKRIAKKKKVRERFYFSRWLRKIGEAPVVWSSSLSDKTKSQLQQYLKNKGFYNAKIEWDTTTKFFLRRQRIKVKYIITAGEPYTVQNVSYIIEDTNIDSLFIARNSRLSKGMRFDVDSLQAERDRITKLMKQNGYFNFQKEFIYYQMDSTGVSASQKLDLVLNIQLETFTLPDGKTAQRNHQKYRISKVLVFNNYQPRRAILEQESYFKSLDTTRLYGITFLSDSSFRFKNKVLSEANYIYPDSIYNVDNVNFSYSHFSSLRTFRLVNINLFDSGKKGSDSTGLLDCYIQLTPGKVQSISLETEGTFSQGDWGVGGSATYQHKNIFRGAENFKLKLSGSRETMLYKNDLDLSSFNTSEAGVSMQLLFPRFFWFGTPRNFTKKYNPQTSFALTYNYQLRPEYTRNIFNTTFGYQWQGKNAYTRHYYNPFDVFMVNLRATTDDLPDNFASVFIAAQNYSFLFNDQNRSRTTPNYSYLRFGVETSGFTTQLTQRLFDSDENDIVFGIQYAQYLKFDIDTRYYQIFNTDNKFVYRIYTGIGLPYGNSTELPFIRRYYSGGANSVRAWRVRTLGPGSSVSNQFVYNQLGDIKLEANWEYRFDMPSILEGALFVDAGNIWNRHASSEQSGANFSITRFYKEIAVGAGFGLRFDLSFFVFRLDTGVQLYDPRYGGSPWRSDNTNSKIALSFGIGYPF